MNEFESEFKIYFNYFTEIEEHFQIARGTGFFRLSPLDWALVEVWKDAGVPLEAVLRGIDAAFEKWRTRKNRTQMVNSITYCAQAIAKEAEEMAGTPAGRRGKPVEMEAPFTLDEMRSYFLKNAADLSKAGFEEIAAKLTTLADEAEQHYADLEGVEQVLTALEDKMIAVERARLTEDDLIVARRELELQLKPYRSKMNAGQLTMLEKQFLERRLLEQAGLPRLSLFYLR